MTNAKPKPPRRAVSPTSTMELYKLLLESEKFHSWKKHEPVFSGVERSPLMSEPHYTPAELAELWGVDPETIRNVFRNEPGVLKLGNNGGKRTYVTLRIPESVAERVHRRLSA
jgi:hypothetical protein